nr:Golgi transport complex subunit 1 [Polyrhizophydium stewartii]
MDADVLLAKHGVGELKAILAKIKADADRKKHDLRIMVGERYRDVIGAADAIQVMREATQKMGDLFDQTDALCDVAALKRRVLQQTASSSDVAAEDRKRQLFPVAAQIRLLIWSALESQQFLSASRLYLISRLVFRGLQTPRPGSAINVLASFPVVQRQWDAISPFRTQIVEKATENLRNVELSDRTILETLGAISMLDNQTPRALLDTFLAQRAKALEQIFADASTKSAPAGQSADDVAQQIIGSLRLVQRTLETVHALFHTPTRTDLEHPAASPSSNPAPAARQPEAARIVVFLTSLQQPSAIDSTAAPADSQRLVASLYSEKANVNILFRHLPEPIQRFVPVINLGPSGAALDNAFLQSSSRSWLSKIAEQIQTAGGRAAVAIYSGAVLAAARASVIEFIGTIETEPVGGVLSAQSISVCRKLFLARSKKLIETAFEPIVRQPRTLLSASVDHLSHGGHADRDVASFVWNAGSSGPGGASGVSGVVADIMDRAVTHEALQAVCRMQTPAMSDLGEAFESAAVSVLEDILPLLGRAHASGRQATAGRRGSVYAAARLKEPKLGMFDLRADAEALASALQDAFSAAVKAYRDGMLAHLNSIQSKMSEANIAEYVLGIDQCLFIGRTARIIAIKVGRLHPAFDIKFDGDSAQTSSISLTHQLISSRLAQAAAASDNDSATASGGSADPALDVHRHLLPSQEQLMEVYNQAHVFWIKSVGERLEGKLLEQLESHDWRHGERFQALWEDISVQAHDEGGSVLESKFSLPVHASSFVMNVLFDVCVELNRIGGYTLEKPCLRLLLLELSARILRVYSTFVTAHVETDGVSEKGTLQLLFDFSFLVKVIEGSWAGGARNADLAAAGKRSDEAGSSERDASAISAQIKQKIDPIDLSLVETHVAANVSRFYNRTSVLLGSLLLLNPKPLETKRNPSLQEQHNLVSVAPPSARFALLPIAGAAHMRTAQSRKGTLSQQQMPPVLGGKLRSGSTAALSQGSTEPVTQIRPARSRQKPRASIRLSRGGTQGTAGAGMQGQAGSASVPLMAMDRLASISSALGSAFGGAQAGTSASSTAKDAGAAAGGGRVMGIIPLSSSQQQRATELFMNASSFISGVWGTSSSAVSSPSGLGRSSNAGSGSASSTPRRN